MVWPRGGPRECCFEGDVGPGEKASGGSAGSLIAILQLKSFNAHGNHMPKVFKPPPPQMLRGWAAEPSQPSTCVEVA